MGSVTSQNSHIKPSPTDAMALGGGTFRTGLVLDEVSMEPS